MFRFRRLALVPAIIFFGLSGMAEVGAIDFARGHHAFLLQHVETGELRSVNAAFGYAKPSTDFERSTADDLKNSNTGSVIYGKWSAIRNFSCFDPQRDAYFGPLPRCDQKALKDLDRITRLSLRDIGFTEKFFDYFLPGFVGSVFAGIFLSPLTFLVFYPVASIIWWSGFRKASRNQLTFLFAPFLWAMFRWGIPGFSLDFGSAWAWLELISIIGPGWIFGWTWIVLESFFISWKYPNGLKQKTDDSIAGKIVTALSLVPLYIIWLVSAWNLAESFNSELSKFWTGFVVVAIVIFPFLVGGIFLYVKFRTGTEGIKKRMNEPSWTE